MIRQTKVGWLVLGLLMAAGPTTGATLLVPSQFPTIQAAVDAAAAGGGDEIVVSAGEYEEQVVITKDLTITGAGIGLTILRAPVYMPHVTLGVQYNAVIHAESLIGTIVLRDFSINGAGRGRAGTRFTGLIYDRCGGVAERLEISDIYETPLEPVISGIGFYSYAEGDDGLHLRVEDLTITRFQKTGLAVFGHGCEVDLRNVVADASNFYTDSVQNGFELLNGSIGTITNCTARSCWYDGYPGPNYASCGFLFYFVQSWSLAGSLSDQNQVGIYCLASDVALADSEIFGLPENLNFNYGVVTTGLGPALTTAPRLAAAPDLALPRTLSTTEHPLTSELGKTVTLDGCRLIGEKTPFSLGLLTTSGGFEGTILVNNCEIADWDVGIFTYENLGWVVGRAQNCLFQGNTTFAIRAETLGPFDARGNNWGDPTGPFHPETNPAGLGEEVGDNVLFDPWLQGTIVCGPVPQYISLADTDGSGYSHDVTVRYLGGADQPVYGFSTELTWNQELLTAEISDVSRPDSGLFQSAALFQVLPIVDGFRIEAALGGSQSGILTGELFKVRFHLVGEPSYVEIPISLNLRHLRDNQNREIVGQLANDGLVIGDLKAPTITSVDLTNTSLAHTNDFAKNGDQIMIEATVFDGDPVFGQSHIRGNFLFLFGGSGYWRLPQSYLADTALWAALPAELFPADGPITYSVTATDPAGNTTTTNLNTITADNTPPLAITGLSAVTGHNNITLQWDDPTDRDANLRQVVLRSRGTQDYPLFAGQAPAFPSSPTDGEAVYSGLGSSTVAIYESDGSARDIVSFQAFAIDQVDLVSPAEPDSRDRATNYFLADVTADGNPGYDGETGIFDVTRLGSTFGLFGTEFGFDGECDVGPTDDGTSDGLPLPDGEIGIDDLMVFADRFDAMPQPPGAPTVATLSTGPQLQWSRLSPDEWVLALTNPCPQLKGLRLLGETDGNTTVDVRPGELLSRQGAPYFLKAKERSLDVCLALLGREVGFDGTGELLRVTTSQPLERLTLEVTARSVHNVDLEADLEQPFELTSVPALPTVFALHGNYPNPFNPATTIVFDLPTPQAARLVVYTLDGRRVAGLLNGRLPAGQHEVVWRGRDDNDRTVAAGIYLFRLEAGAWSATGKMNLVK